MRMIVYCGWTRTTEVAMDVEDLGSGAGRTRCLECGGLGVWALMEPEIPASACVDCKGTGKILVSIQ